MTDTATQDFHDARNPMLLSYSGIAAYQTCRERWKLQNVYGLKTATASLPMDVGSAVHAGMEAYLRYIAYLGIDPDVGLDVADLAANEGIDRWVEGVIARIPMDEGETIDDYVSIRDHLDEVAGIAYQVVPRVIDEIERRGLTVVRNPKTNEPLIEAELMVPIPGWDGFASHLDAVLQDPKGQVWITDFKVRKTFYDEASEDVNLQNATYQHMLTATTGIVATGTLTLQVRSAPITKPELTQKGTMSKKAIVCDWDTYAAAVVAAGLNPADYEDMRDKLSTIEWVRPLEAYRSLDTIARIWNNIVRPVAFEMARVRDRLMSPTAQDRVVGARQAHRSLSARTCLGCNVQAVCISALKGWDVSTALRGYRYRDEIVADAIERGTL